MLPEHLLARVSLGRQGDAEPRYPAGRRGLACSSDASTEPSVLQQEIDRRVCTAVGALVALTDQQDRPTDREAARLAREAVPLAVRLGMWTLKRRLEDAALRVSAPDRHQLLEEHFAAFRADQDDVVTWTRERLEDSFAEANVEFEIRLAFCSLGGVARRLAELGVDDSFGNAHVGEFYDLLILVHQDTDCYKALAAVHGAGTPIPGTLRDLVASPQANGFSGISTQIALETPDGGDNAIVVQVSIQTHTMRSVARFGVVAQECYPHITGARLHTVGRPRCVDALLTSLEQSLPRQRMTVLAAGGNKRLIRAYGLASGATVLDLAYKIHSKLGNRAGWARVNKKAVALGHILEPYDRVEIIVETGVERSEDDLAFVTTKTAIRNLRHNLYRSHVVRGRSLLRQYLEAERSIFLERAQLDRLVGELARRKAATLTQATPEALYRAISTSDEQVHSPGFVGTEIAELLSNELAKHDSAHDPPNVEWLPTATNGTVSIPRRVRLCARCMPRPRETIVGVVRARYLAVHRSGCSAIGAQPAFDLTWTSRERRVNSTLTLFCDDRARLVEDVCRRIAYRGAGLAETHATTDAFFRTRISITVYTPSAIELGELIEDLQSIPGVQSIELDATTLPDDEKDSVVTGDWSRMRRRERQGRSTPDRPRIMASHQGAGRRNRDVTIHYNEQRPVFEAYNFFGRSEEILQLERRVLGRSPSMVFLTAPRRTGKTSLALRFTDRLDVRDRPCQKLIDLRSEHRTSSRGILEMIAAALRSLATSQVERNEDPRVEIASIVRSCRKPVVLVLDEFGAVLKSYHGKTLGPELFAWLRTLLEIDTASELQPHQLSAERLRVILASPPECLDMLAKADTASELNGRVLPMHIWSLDHAGTHEMIVRPFREAGIFFAPEAATELATVTGRHPYLLIPLLKVLADRVNGRPYKQNVNTRDITESTRLLLSDPLLARVIVNEPGGPPEHYACLRAMAQTNAPTSPLLSVYEIAGKAGLDHSSADKALKELAAYTVVIRHVSPGGPDRYTIAIPFIRAWLRRNASVDQATDLSIATWDQS
jgi:GTP diphosphokinase / guanosine-3',5'-bis(diphosphate) 3'-diphosphatase